MTSFRSKRSRSFFGKGLLMMLSGILVGLFSQGVSAQCGSLSAPSICMTSVDSTGDNMMVVWNDNNDPLIEAVEVYRKEGNDSYNSWPIATVHTDSLSMYIDSSFVYPDSLTYSYKLAYRDTCGNTSPVSLGHTMLKVEGYVSNDLTPQLDWTAYEGFSYSWVYIWKDANGDGNYSKYDSVNTGGLGGSYIDNAPYDTSTDTFSYFLEIKNPCTASRAKNFNSTRSNRQNISGGFEESTSVFRKTSDQQEIEVFPNPSEGHFNIRIPASFKGRVLKVISARGRVVADRQVRPGQAVYDLSGIDAGVYSVQVTGEGTSSNKTIIVR